MPTPSLNKTNIAHFDYHWLGAAEMASSLFSLYFSTFQSGFDKDYPLLGTVFHQI